MFFNQYFGPWKLENICHGASQTLSLNMFECHFKSHSQVTSLWSHIGKYHWHISVLLSSFNFYTKSQNRISRQQMISYIFTRPWNIETIFLFLNRIFWTLNLLFNISNWISYVKMLQFQLGFSHVKWHVKFSFGRRAVNFFSLIPHCYSETARVLATSSLE